MFIFNKAFTANSKKSGQPFYSVNLFERRTAQSGEIYFKDVACFVEKSVFERILKSGFKFGDVVELEKGEPAYFGAAEQLIGLTLKLESPYYEL